QSLINRFIHRVFCDQVDVATGLRLPAPVDSPTGLLIGFGVKGERVENSYRGRREGDCDAPGFHLCDEYLRIVLGLEGTDDLISFASGLPASEDGMANACVRQHFAYTRDVLHEVAEDNHLSGFVLN